MSDTLRETLLELTENTIPNKKAENVDAAKHARSINTDDIDVLKSSFHRHTRINVYLIWFLAGVIFVLSGVFLTAYCRLQDAISSQGDSLNLRIDNEKESNTRRIDQLQQFYTQRFDSIYQRSQEQKRK